MLKLLTLLVVLTSFLYASDKVEIYATSMDSQDNIVKATGEVTVVYKDYFLSAQNATYDKKSGELELFGNIRASQGKNYKLLGDYARLNIAKKERTFKPFFMLEKESKVWISADEGCALNKDFDISSGVMSGCNPNDPLWKIHFSSSTYNSDDKWLNIYNARIFIYDIPVFYTPYFGYSLDTTRRTGLLTPAFGTSAVEGVYYEQPIYIAEQNWWDLELKPQVRTSRGYGGYTTFRFVDSKISKGEFTTGYFKEKDSYFKSNNLANDTHYGYNFLYDNSDVINQWFGTNFKGQSGLYMDLNSMNDVDYINLSTNDTTQNATATQNLSRVNLFYNTDNNYFGAYFKYYQDLTKVSNEDTLQKLPTFQYHRYLDTLFGDHLIYSLDMQSNNIYREVGKHVTQTDLNIPITLQTSIFDEYLNTSYKAYIYAQHSKFSGTETVKTGNYENGYFARNYHVFSASSQVSRAFEDFTHVVGFGSTYTIGGAETKTGFYVDYETFCSDANNKNTPQCEFYNITAIEEELKLDFTQYLYDIEGTQILYHRLAQNISYQNSGNSLGELENELDYQITKGLKLYNNMFYNYDQNKLSKLYNQLTFNESGFSVSFSHLYKDTFLEKTATYTPYTSYITSSASYTYNKHYSYDVTYNYDVESSLKKSASIGFLYKKRCWDFGLKYLENNRPVLTDTGSTSIYDRYIYFTVVLKPMMSSGSGPLFEYKLPETTQGL
ncbi:LPS-assembly protein LptD [Sulfurimonas sp.]|uniref:LPS-assembly protein LptD n=1 Tax=Sulfurimonas sp. TaxID=2022749 RepID=UPI0035639506